MVMWSQVQERCGAGSRVAAVVAVAVLGMTGCVMEAGDESESIDSAAQALCTGVKLSIDPTGILLPNSAALLTASNATCGAGEVAEYRFMYKIEGNPAPYAEFRGWSTEPTALFDNTERLSGKYTLQVRARKVGSTALQNSQATLGLRSGEVCTNVTLKVAPKAPQLPGKAISLTPQATCTGGTPEYKFSVRAPGTSTYVPLGPWTGSNMVWDTTGLELGSYTLRVDARRAGNTSASEAKRTASYTLADSCQGVTMKFLPASPQPAGTMVTVEAQASCAGGTTPQFRYNWRLKGTPTWSLLQNWSSEASAPWDTTDLDPTTYNIQVEVRSPGVTKAQASKVSDYTVTSPL